MSRKNRFGFDSVAEVPTGAAPRRRGSGPMSTAVREAAENLAESTEAKVEARKKNAADARDFRDAMADGRVLSRVPLDGIATDDLPRDRLDLEGVALSDEMDELKSSILTHGQKEPIELYERGGSLQLKKGWRRLTALRALHAETGEDRFATALARIDQQADDRVRLYVDMVEENILRQDLTFAEMAQLAIEAAQDPAVEAATAEDMVTPLYASLHKMKRSYIRAFVTLLQTLGDDLQWPKAVPRNLGVDVVRTLRERGGDAGALRRELVVCGSEKEQNAVLTVFASGPSPEKPTHRDTRKKFEFHVADVKVTARKGELRLKAATDFSELPRDRLELAVAAFRRALDESG